MQDELEIVQLTMDIFEKMRQQESNKALRNWMKVLPDTVLRGSAMQLLRQYMKQRDKKSVLSADEKHELASQTARLVIDGLLQKERQVMRTGKTDVNLDGAELFYRRALSHIAMERYSEAERLLKRAVEISPGFTDGWETFAEVLEQNGKKERAAEARAKLSLLRLADSSTS